MPDGSYLIRHNGQVIAFYVKEGGETIAVLYLTPRQARHLARALTAVSNEVERTAESPFAKFINQMDLSDLG